MKSGRRSTGSAGIAVQRAKRAATPKSGLGPPRDFVGYGRNPPHPQWPGGARIAVNFNLNVEAGGERSLLEGDKASESVLSDTGFPAYDGARSPMVESSFEYGPRVGSWRLMRIFKKFDVRISVLAVVRGLQHYPDLAAAFVEEGHEIVSHGWRWIDYTKMSEREERKHIALATEGLAELTGRRPVGWFSGRPSVNTRRLVVDEGGYLYDRDYLGDELPFWVDVGERQHLVVPYSYETNDNRFDQNNGFSTADEFARYLDRLLRPHVRGRRRNAQDHERRAPRPPHRPPGPRGRAHQVSRARAPPRPRLVLHRPRHRRALAQGAPAGRLRQGTRPSAC